MLMLRCNWEAMQQTDMAAGRVMTKEKLGGPWCNIEVNNLGKSNTLSWIVMMEIRFLSLLGCWHQFLSLHSVAWLACRNARQPDLQLRSRRALTKFETLREAQMQFFCFKNVLLVRMGSQ
jgi:hypothetical protein